MTSTLTGSGVRLAAAVRAGNRVRPLLPEAVRHLPQARRACRKARKARRG
ncbi:hypothetical protein [Actinomadura sp.]